MAPTMCVRYHTTSLSSDLLEGICLTACYTYSQDLLQQRKDLYSSERSRMHFPVLFPGPDAGVFSLGMLNYSDACVMSLPGEVCLSFRSEALL